MGVRLALKKDTDRIVTYLKEVHKDTSRNAPFCPQNTKKTIQVALNNQKAHAVWIIELEGEVRGILIGVTNMIWYSRKKQALDLIFYVSEDARGFGAHMVRRFLTWAKEMPGVAEIFLSETYGASERTKKMYERMGLEHVGNMFRQEVKHEQSN